ncbi:MAG: hypothetical protein V4519_04790 [Patescibacteria group bacterium]
MFRIKSYVFALLVTLAIASIWGLVILTFGTPWLWNNARPSRFFMEAVNGPRFVDLITLGLMAFIGHWSFCYGMTLRKEKDAAGHDTYGRRMLWGKSFSYDQVYVWIGMVSFLFMGFGTLAGQGVSMAFFGGIGLIILGVCCLVIHYVDCKMPRLRAAVMKPKIFLKALKRRAMHVIMRPA